ncbi:hypothetical protein BU25DRAFT_411814 [Macroventuria anomochaeta]|uniref:Uncharacterized protein n=1 Tax=Macroventuria anomochaeta TaxID=301207 RepID=A0ACB6RWN0_9PLEO|nr:uncharacterized protein BU25DRAFT_411814 [Macroventuria anomochaeta]KAF2626420.1 hypothetical protein BU25DRAFT_411814 [Macroventuria anomochaeta]
MAKGELFAFGTAAAALGGAYKLSEFLYKAKRLRDVGPSNAVYVRIIGRVRSDLDEVRRLLSVREVHDALESNPEKSKWVYGCMRDVRGALENITPHTERVGGDIEEGRRVGVRHRVYWLLSEKEKLENREKELAIAHASLTEVIGFLSGLEPIEAPKQKHQKEEKTRDTHIDIDIRREAPTKHTEHVKRDVWIERDGPVPPRYEERRDIYIDERGPRHFDDRGDQHQRDLDFERYDPADPRYQQHTTERFEQHDQYERRAPHPDDRHYAQAPLGRRPESFEDRVPERDSWMQSSANHGYGPYGAQQYQRRFRGDAGFGDEEVLNPQPVPPNQQYSEREVWVEEKEDYRFDEYGNRLPDRYFRPEYASVPRPYKSRM